MIKDQHFQYTCIYLIKACKVENEKKNFSLVIHHVYHCQVHVLRELVCELTYFFFLNTTVDSLFCAST